MARAAATLGADGGGRGPRRGDRDAWPSAGRGGDRDHRVATPGETRTCVSIGAAGRRELTEVYEYAGPIPADVWDRRSRRCRPPRAADRAGWSISGGPPRELPSTAIAELAGSDVEPADGSPSTPTAPACRCCRRPELVKINRFEAADLLGRARTPSGALAEAVRAGAAAWSC